MKEGRAWRLMKSFVRHPVASLRAFMLPGAIPSGVGRWKDTESLHQAWDERTRQIARHIQPGSSVLEFGAGRLALARYLPPDCTYQPSDIVARSTDTLVCDLNQALPVLSRDYDVAVFSGVLEYVNDLAPLRELLARHCASVIASYASTEECADELTRRLSGWVNDFSRAEFVAGFESAGFALDGSEPWGTQTIYIFRNAKSPGGAGAPNASAHDAS